jgi:hypothetical protein
LRCSLPMGASKKSVAATCGAWRDVKSKPKAFLLG